MSHNTTSIASILKVRLGLDVKKFTSIKVHSTSLLIKLLTHKLTASFWKSTNIAWKQGIKSNEKLYNLKRAITDLWYVSLLLLIINTFNGNIESTVMEMALIEIFCSYYVNKKCKDAFPLTGNFHH